jgi:hypothetical protein
MSYDISLRDPATGETAIVPDGHDLRGGTYVSGGTDEAWLNVTYNYSRHYYRVFGANGVRTIYGMTGRESVPVLDAAIAQLGEDTDSDYWTPTEGNARAALENLRLLARACPDAVRNGD